MIFIKPFIPYILAAVGILVALSVFVTMTRSSARKDVIIDQAISSKKEHERALKNDNRNRKRIDAEPDILLDDGFRRD